MFDSRKKLNLAPPSDQISFQVLPEDIEVQASQKQTILEAILNAHIELDHSCGGMGSCGTCRVYIMSGLELLGPRDELETEIAEDRKFAIEERLACQNKVVKGLILRKPS